MTYFSALTAADRVIFEGKEVTKIIPLKDGGSKEVTHYSLSVLEDKTGAVLRKFLASEIPYLLENEILEIDRGYYSAARQADRQNSNRNDLFGIKKKSRLKIESLVFLCHRVEHYRKLGMPLTVEGVANNRPALDEDYKRYQARVKYGTESWNSTQLLKPLPSNWMLLKNFRDYQAAGNTSAGFLPQQNRPFDLDHQASMDLLFILRILYRYASPTPYSKYEIAQEAVIAAKKENLHRIDTGFRPLIDVKSARTYERWIDKYLDPFTIEVERKGFAAAKAKFGLVESGKRASFPGQAVQLDAWMVHVVTLDTTRAKYNAMTPEQRAKVKRVRRWVIVAIDVATRVILGYAFCRAPNQEASLKALRLCFADKTDLLQKAGLTESTWNFRAPIHLFSTDSGSEFGKHPFGGALFAEAVRTLTGSLMNTVAAVPELRAHIERSFLTFDLLWARHQPGWTAGRVHLRNDRKPHEEACMTDDELEHSFVRFIADYHTRAHRGIGGYTPAGMWEKLSKDPQYDPSMLPGPAALREACGSYERAGVSEEGIRFKNLVYSNEFIRDQRSAKGTERIAKPGDQLEIKVDELDLGAITVVTPNDMISVPCIDQAMRGKSLEWWMVEQRVRKAGAAADVAKHAAANREAQQTWKGEVSAIARSAGVNLIGRSPDEIERLARTMRMGKGAHEQPFMSEAEYGDPVQSGFPIGTQRDHADSVAATSADNADQASHRSGSLDRFRAKARQRAMTRRDAEDRE